MVPVNGIEGVQRRFTRMIGEWASFHTLKGQRLQILNLTTLIECHSRGDLIDVFKDKNAFSDIRRVFSFGRSRSNLISSMNSYSGSAQFRKIKRNFINENNYWEVSNLILEKIEGNSDNLVNKSKVNKFLITSIQGSGTTVFETCLKYGVGLNAKFQGKKAGSV